jgi:hypothetical protein
MSETPTAYIIETFVPGYRPTVSRFSPAEFDHAWGLYLLLSGVSEDAGHEPGTVQWSVEY